MKRRRINHIIEVRPCFYDAILNNSLSISGASYKEGDLIKYVEVNTRIGVEVRPPLIRRLRKKEEINDRYLGTI